MMVSVNSFVPKPLMLSVAFAVKLNAPVAVGVPLICPAELSVIPAGSEPLLIDHV